MSNRASKQPSVLDQNLLLCKLQICRNRCLINLTLNQIFAMLTFNNKEFLEKCFSLSYFQHWMELLLAAGSSYDPDSPSSCSASAGRSWWKLSGRSTLFSRYHGSSERLLLEKKIQPIMQMFSILTNCENGSKSVTSL